MASTDDIIHAWPASKSFPTGGQARQKTLAVLGKDSERVPIFLKEIERAADKGLFRTAGAFILTPIEHAFLCSKQYAFERIVTTTPKEITCHIHYHTPDEVYICWHPEH